MRLLQTGDEKAALQSRRAPAHMPARPVPQTPGASAMFHHDDHIRLAFGAPRRPGLTNSRARARNTDIAVVLDKLGLSGRARKL
jgi:hypothetical protein